MKLFPCLTLAALCAAFAGCASTTQTVSFQSYSGQTGVTIFVDGKEIGTTGSGPLSIEFQRPAGLVVYDVVCKKDGFVSDSFVMESAVDSDGRYSFFDDYPIPELMASDEPVAPSVSEPADNAVVETPAPQETVVAAPAEEPAPQPGEDEEIAAAAVATDSVPAGEQGAVVAEETVAVVDAPVETPPEPVAAPVPPAEQPQTPVVVATPEPQPPVSVPQPVPETKKAAVPLDPSRTLKDIESEINLLSQQRQNGQLSEKEFQKACEALEKEVRERYER